MVCIALVSTKIILEKAKIDAKDMRTDRQSGLKIEETIDPTGSLN